MFVCVHLHDMYVCVDAYVCMHVNSKDARNPKLLVCLKIRICSKNNVLQKLQFQLVCTKNNGLQKLGFKGGHMLQYSILGHVSVCASA